VIVVLSIIAWPAFAQEFFDADGYYYPEEQIVVEGFRFDWFSLETVSYYNDGKLDYEHPRYIGPNASLLLVRTKDERKFSYRFPRPTIGKNKIFLTSVATPIGIVTIKGTFLDTRGMFWNRPDVIVMETPVFEGTLTVVRGGKRVYKKVGRFVFWEGD
jgi:hypothetical protein